MEADDSGWQLTQMSGDGTADGGWMYVFQKKQPDLPFYDQTKQQQQQTPSSSVSSPPLSKSDSTPQSGDNSHDEDNTQGTGTLTDGEFSDTPLTSKSDGVVLEQRTGLLRKKHSTSM